MSFSSLTLFAHYFDMEEDSLCFAGCLSFRCMVVVGFSSFAIWHEVSRIMPVCDCPTMASNELEKCETSFESLKWDLEPC